MGVYLETIIPFDVSEYKQVEWLCQMLNTEWQDFSIDMTKAVISGYERIQAEDGRPTNTEFNQATLMTMPQWEITSWEGEHELLSDSEIKWRSDWPYLAIEQKQNRLYPSSISIFRHFLRFNNSVKIGVFFRALEKDMRAVYRKMAARLQAKSVVYLADSCSPEDNCQNYQTYYPYFPDQGTVLSDSFESRFSEISRKENGLFYYIEEIK